MLRKLTPLALRGREALLRYALRPPIADERLELRPEGLLRISLKRAYADRTVAVDMDPLSLVCRLATSVPPPRLHTIKYAGVLASACSWRARIAPPPPAEPAAPPAEPDAEPSPRRGARTYRPWAELLMRSFGLDVREGRPAKAACASSRWAMPPEQAERSRHRSTSRDPRWRLAFGA